MEVRVLSPASGMLGSRASLRCAAGSKPFRAPPHSNHRDRAARPDRAARGRVPAGRRSRAPARRRLAAPGASRCTQTVPRRARPRARLGGVACRRATSSSERHPASPLASCDGERGSEGSTTSRTARSYASQGCSSRPRPSTSPSARAPETPVPVRAVRLRALQPPRRRAPAARATGCRPMAAASSFPSPTARAEHTTYAGRPLPPRHRQGRRPRHCRAAALVLDFNFAYQPSCSYDDRWGCPLAPASNRLDVDVEAGERFVPLSG